MVASIKDELSDLAAKNKVAPTLGTFDEGKGVAGRVNQITTSGSPLMQTARTRAAQQSAKRGLMNSSIGVQAGEQAVIETAAPIASADASLYQQQQLANQSAQNNASIINANNAISAGTRGRELDLNESQFGRSLYEQGRQFDTNTGLRGRELTLAEKTQGDNLGLERSRLSQQDAQFQAGLGLDRDRLGEQRRQFDTSQTENQRQFDVSTDQRMALAQLDVQSRRELAEIEAAFKNEIQSSANISNAWGTMMDSIARIQNNPELDPAAKTALIQNNIDGFAAFSNFWKKATGGAVDVSDLLNFQMAPTPGGGGGGGGGGGNTPAPGYDNDGNFDWMGGSPP